MSELNNERREEKEIENMGKLIKINDLEGHEVKNTNGDKLGKLDDIVIDYYNGVIAYGILSVGGFLGIGDDLYAIPWKSLKLDSENKVFILDVDKDKLKNAPSFEKGKWPNMDKREWHTDIHTYYAMQPYWKYPQTMVDEDTATKDADVAPRKNQTYL